LNRRFRSSPRPCRDFVQRLATVAIALAICSSADPATAQKLRLRNDSETNLVAYRPVPKTADGKREFVPDSAASLAAGASAWLPNATTGSVFYDADAERGLQLRVTIDDSDDGKRTRTLAVHKFTGPPPWPLDNPATPPEQWSLAPGSPSVVTLTKDWDLLVRPVIPTKLVLDPATVAGGIEVTAKVSFNASSDEGTPITLKSSVPEVAAVPAEATADGTEFTFIVKTSNVEKAQEIEISASAGGVLETAKVTVEPRAWRIVAVTFNRRNLIGGQPVLGTVHVEGMTEDTEPVVVRLRSMSENTTVADSVLVTYAPRLSRATFDIETMPVTHLQKGGIYASLAGEEKWGGFNLSPLAPVAFSTGRTTVTPGENLDTLLRFRLRAPSPAAVLVTATPQGIVKVPDRVVLETGETEIRIPVSVQTDIDAKLPVSVTVKATMQEVPQLAREIRFEIVPR